MKIPWNFFARRRGYDLTKMLAEGRFKTYEDYVKWCEAKNVAPINESEFKSIQPVPAKPKQVSKVKKPAAKPAIKKAKTTKPQKPEQGKTDDGNKSGSKTSTRRRRTPAVKKS